MKVAAPLAVSFWPKPSQSSTIATPGALAATTAETVLEWRRGTVYDEIADNAILVDSTSASFTAPTSIQSAKREPVV